MHLAFLLGVCSIRRRSPRAKHTVVFLASLLLFVWGVTACLSVGGRLLGVTLAHYDDSLNVASGLGHCLLLMGHGEVMMRLVLDLPGATVSLEMMILNVNCLLLFVRNLLPNKVLMRASKRRLQRSAQSHLLVPLKRV